MKINYTALFLTVVALAGLAIYRMLMPDEFVMLLSKPDNSGFVYAHSENTEHWIPLQKDEQSYRVNEKQLMNHPVLLKEASYTFRLFYNTPEPDFKLITAESNDLMEWDKKRQILTQQGDSVLAFRVIKSGKRSWHLLLLKKMGSGCYIESFLSDDLKSFHNPDRVLSSNVYISDFNVVSLDHGFLMFTLNRIENGPAYDFKAWFSTDLKESLIPVKTGNATVTFESLNALFVNGDEICIVANHNQVLRLRREDTDSFDYFPEVEATNVPSHYGIYSVINMRKDEVRRLDKTIANME